MRVVLRVVLIMMMAAMSCATETTDVAKRIDALMSRYLELGQFNGSVLVAQGGEMVLEKGYGMANFEWEVPNTPDAKFRLGSITKQFTSMVVMQLVEEGNLALDDTLSEMLPWYRDDTGSQVTLHQLLNHTSGIPSYTGLPGFFAEHSRDPLPLKELVNEFCSGDLEFEPRSEFRYNNSGYVILGAVIEEATGEPYEQVL